MTTIAYVPDLMDRSRLSAVAAVTFVDRPDDLPSAAIDADLVVVDLGRPGVLDALAKIATPTIGFGSHVDRELLEAGRRLRPGHAPVGLFPPRRRVAGRVGRAGVSGAEVERCQPRPART